MNAIAQRSPRHGNPYAESLHRQPNHRAQTAKLAFAERDVAAVSARDVARDRKTQAHAA